jgi:LysR family transcriptional regulator, transcriptional activator for dmlA
LFPKKKFMERSDLELVLAVREHRSLAATAMAMNVVPSVITKRLSALEKNLGLRLFQRTTRHVSPTAEGDALCERAVKLLLDFKALESDLLERHNEPTGTIRLAGTLGFGRLWLGPALADFQTMYPKLQIQLQLTEQLPDLAVQGFDGAVWLWAIQGARASEWFARRLARNQRVLVAAPAYVARRGTPNDVQALAEHDCLVVRENDQRFDTWLLHRDKEKVAHRVAVVGPLSSNSGELVRDWCLSGHGIMLRSLWDIAPQLQSGALVRVLPDYAMMDADIHWLAPYRTQTPKRIRLLIDFLVDRFRNEPWKVTLPGAPPSSRRQR